MADTPTLPLVLSSVERRGLRWSAVAAERPVRWLHRRAAPDALLYDLAPFTPAARVFVEDVRHAAPQLPVLLFPPTKVGVGELLRRCARLPLVQVELQDPSIPLDVTLLPALERMLRDAPAGRVLDMMTNALPGRRVMVRQFLSGVLYGLQAGRFPAGVRLDVVARALGTTRRSIERDWKADAVMAPRELAGWATVLLITCCAETLETTNALAARRLGFGAQQLYRLRRRLFGRRRGERPAPPSFLGVFFAFTDRCRERRFPLRLR